MHPAGGDGFDFPHHIRQAMHRPEANEQMDMVSDAADGFRNPLELFYDAAEEGMEAIPPRGGNHADAFFRAEDEMVVEREVSGCHGAHIVRCPCRGNGAYLSEKGLSECDGFHRQIQGDPADSESPEGWQRLAGGVSHRLSWKIDLSPGRGGIRPFRNRQGVAPPGAFNYFDRLTGGLRHRLI